MLGTNSTSNHREYAENIKTLARSNRKHLTKAETKIWFYLRREFLGHRFRRQYPIDNKYIADFVCLEKRLIIEIDGGQHSDNEKEDLLRTQYLESQKFRVIRFWNMEIFKDFDTCMQKIHEVLNNKS
jgi:very-short-patch-repair endonuclease